MKPLITMLFLIGMAVSVHSQTEFPLHENNLIYDVRTMQTLGVIVDSLNLKFRSCDLSHPYYSLPQGTATYLFFERDIKDVQAAIRKNISFEDLIKQFAPSKIKRDVRIVRSTYTRGNEKTVAYSTFPQSREDDILDITLPYDEANIKIKGWVSQSNSSYVWAFYINSLDEYEIPRDYARLIQYVDCMIDTTAAIYFSDASRSVRFAYIGENSKATRFIEYANDFRGKPVPPKHKYRSSASQSEIEKEMKSFDSFKKNLRRWDSLRVVDLDKRVQESPRWLITLKEASDEALQGKGSNDDLEFYIDRYISPEVALQLKRNRRVIGGCSMDQGPRTHAVNICMLAARTAKWDIFLRSHLDIMNDRFDRTSDGTWAFEGRQTYLKELEELDINATDLLLGTSLRTISVSDSHYFGNIGRVGRALAETSTHEAVEKQMLEMVGDSKLDLFNRLLMAKLFHVYNHYLDDEILQQRNSERLEVAIADFPEGLREGFRK